MSFDQTCKLGGGIGEERRRRIKLHQSTLLCFRNSLQRRKSEPRTLSISIILSQSMTVSSRCAMVIIVHAANSLLGIEISTRNGLHSAMEKVKYRMVA
jgi:hypothetical protein